MYQEEALSDAYMVIAPDLPGFGGSASLAGPYALDRQRADVIDLLREVIDAPAVLVGFAFGAAVALSVAAQEPRICSGVVSIGVPSAAHAAYDRMPRAMRRDWPEFANRSARAICASQLSEASFRWLSEMFAGTPLPVALETVAVLGQFEPLPLAKTVMAPTLFVHGAEDAIVPIAVSEACANAMPNAKVAVVEDSGHLVPIDQKDVVTALIRDFAQGPLAAVREPNPNLSAE
jgi:pimeloyl-ACP methyl ester carboxylesterase